MNYKPIDMRDLLEKLEGINEINDNIVHTSATRALANEIVYYAKRIAAEHNIDIPSKVWEGIMAKQLANAKQGLEDLVNEARVDAEYSAGHSEAYAKELDSDPNKWES